TRWPRDWSSDVCSSDLRLIAIDHNTNCVKVGSIRPMPRQDAPRQRALQRGKPKHPTRIAPQNELHQPVAQPANAVVKKDGMGHEIGRASCRERVWNEV